jgi:hypothetical protein
MKNKVKLLVPAIIVGCMALFAFSGRLAGSIKGSITPADAAARVWAESPTDTSHAQIMNGNFEISNVKPGTYRIVVEATPPYQNFTKDNVVVADGQATDMGVIKLSR